MPDPTPGSERRRHARSPVIARCQVFSADQHHGEFLVHDLSAGGACLTGRIVNGESTIPVGVGQKLRLMLDLPATPPAPNTTPSTLTLSGRVVRVLTQATPGRFAVQFVGVSAEDEDLIQDSVALALEQQDVAAAAG